MTHAATAKCNVLPAGALPRVFSRVQAAAYVGVSPTLFDRAIKDGKMPKPFPFYGRVLWDVRKLDAAISAMDSGDVVDDPWGSMSL